MVAHESPVRVRILDDEGRPTTHGATVAIEALGFSTSYVLPGSEWSTSVGAGPFAVRVSGARREDGLGLAPWARVGIPQGTTLVEMRLQRAIDVTGRVIDDRGQPVAGAVLEAKSPGEEDRRSSPRRQRASDAGDPGSDVITDREGRFRLECLAAAPYRILATPRDGAARFLQPAVQGGETDVTLTLPATIQAAVTVVATGSRPLAEARVTVLRGTDLDAQFGRYRKIVATATTDAAGIARLPSLVPDPDYELRVEPPPREEGLWREEIRFWRLHDTRVELLLGSALRGHVVSADGTPASGTRVLAAMHGVEWLAGAQSGPDGAFVISGLTPYHDHVMAAPRGWGRRVGPDAPWTIVKFGADDVILHLPPAPTGFKVHVDGGGGHEGFLLGPGEWKGRPLYAFELDAAGNAVFPTLPPGDLSIWILPTQEDPRTAYKTGVPSSDGAASLTLAEPLSIRIHLALADDAWIHSLVVTGPLGSRTPWRRVREGLYEAWGLPPGTYRIDVDVRSLPARVGFALVDAAAGTDVTLEPK